VIASFGDQATRDVFDDENSRTARSIPKDIWKVAQRKLDQLNAAHLIEDLRVPPGNRLEALRGDLAGYWSIRVNDQYRIVFQFNDGHAKDVKIVDYHR
jgi:proteic killer suppression protein